METWRRSANDARLNLILFSVFALVRALRKAFLHLWCFGNHILGIGGPGAPHSFAMDRREDLGGMISATLCLRRRLAKRGNRRSILALLGATTTWLRRHPEERFALFTEPCRLTFVSGPSSGCRTQSSPGLCCTCPTSWCKT